MFINFKKIFALFKKHRAKIGFGVGIAGSIGATVWALKKGSDFQKDAGNDISKLRDLKAIEDKSDEELEAIHELRKKIFVKGLKHFSGVAAAELASCAVATISFVDVSKRLAKATAALAAVHQFAKAEAVEPEQIEQKDPKELTQEDLDVIEAKKLGYGPCAIRLTDNWPEWSERRRNLVTELIHLEDTTEDRFRGRPEFGLFLSCVFEDMRVDQMPEYTRQIKLSRTYGWYGNDMFVDFGLREAQEDGSYVLSLAAQKFIDGEVDYLWLNFNAIPIMDKVF